MKLFITTLLASFAATAQASLSDWSLTLTTAVKNGKTIKMTYETPKSDAVVLTTFYEKDCTTAIDDPFAMGLYDSVQLSIPPWNPDQPRYYDPSSYTGFFDFFFSVDPAKVSLQSPSIFSGGNKAE